MFQRDPIVIDAGFAKPRRPGGPLGVNNIVEPYLTIAVWPDEVWHIQTSRLLGEEAFCRLNLGGILSPFLWRWLWRRSGCY